MRTVTIAGSEEGAHKKFTKEATMKIQTRLKMRLKMRTKMTFGEAGLGLWTWDVIGVNVGQRILMMNS